MQGQQETGPAQTAAAAAAAKMETGSEKSSATAAHGQHMKM
jgi:hypothetical protein